MQYGYNKKSIALQKQNVNIFDVCHPSTGFPAPGCYHASVPHDFVEHHHRYTVYAVIRGQIIFVNARQDGQTDRLFDRLSGKHIQTDRHTDRQTDR